MINFNNIKQQIAHFCKKNTQLKEEAYKDYLIYKWQQENEKLRQENYNGFPISNNEKQAIEEWKRQHNTLIHDNEPSGAIGGRYDYIFTPTSIGDIGICRCSSCEKRILQQVFKEAQEGNNYFIFSQRLKELKERNDVEFVFRHIRQI